ncbi:Signal transduction histidine kinase [Desulforapulum autotrophicum HRM2]|uniref:histidine kinase n=1 Tax=Desulforapulum autotrophicum (strain ATCC 43914 / DSM 3382 / VKM B-1955 / HRM2) TaxID=177437 RepID=C0QG77_DESAH|nr:transporter substrate-binding domain-containing protein [Desulforapulum autotrophicum]ACN17656.1 Signal transduction histidine kinase [Desulforapulum autotrophicum HRM2]
MRPILYSISAAFLTITAVFFFYPSVHEDSVPGMTVEEQIWLDSHSGKVRLVLTPDWPPMDFLDKNGNPAGMAADYIHLIEDKLKFRFARVPVSSWDEMLSLAKKGEIDVISAGQETPARRTFMNWSTPFLNLKTTIIVQKGKYANLTLDRMQGMKIGVVRKYAVGEFIREHHPDLNMIDVADSKTGIEQVSFGELDAMITEVPNALYIIETEKITNLSLAGDTGFELHHGMGIRKDWSILSRIIEKTLVSISEEEHQAIYGRWVTLDRPGFYLSRTFWYWLLGSTGLSLLMTSTVLFWNRSLKREVAQRTEALSFNEIGLEALLRLNETPHKSIQDIVEFSFRQMLDLTQSRFGYLTLREQEGRTYVVENREGDAGGQVNVQVWDGGFEENTKGFWGDAVKKEKPVISNNYHLSNPKFKGVPEAHKKIVRYMNVPISNQGRIVVVAGMGNKKSNYTRSDLRQLNLLAHGMWRLIQRKKAENAMQKSEKRFQDLVENTPNGIAIVQDNRVVHQNANQVHLMGDINFMDPDSESRIHGEDLPKIKSFFSQIRENRLNESEVDFRFHLDNPAENNGAMTWVGCIATPIDYHDRNAFLLIFIDLTEAKKLTRLLTIQDKMASLGNVSAGIAHEIRNPLSGINIYLGTIEKYFRNPDKAKKIASSIEAIRAASGKIESVIKRVMNFAKPGEPRFDVVHINDPIKEAVNLTLFTLNKKGIEIEDDLAENLPACIAEPHLIEEVVLNLINNAADAILEHRDKGHIRISSRQDETKIIIRVEDDGPGVSRDVRQKVFDPFFTTKSHSTGIGLSLCHRIITDHKGKLEIGVSALGGACFRVELPFPRQTVV